MFFSSALNEAVYPRALRPAPAPVAGALLPAGPAAPVQPPHLTGKTRGATPAPAEPPRGEDVGTAGTPLPGQRDTGQSRGLGGSHTTSPALGRFGVNLVETKQGAFNRYGSRTPGDVALPRCSCWLQAGRRLPEVPVPRRPPTRNLIFIYQTVALCLTSQQQKRNLSPVQTRAPPPTASPISAPQTRRAARLLNH